MPIAFRYIRGKKVNLPDNQYKTPESNLNVESGKTGSSVKAIIVGVVVDIIGTMILVTVISIIFSIIWLSQGATQAEVTERFSHPDLLSPFGFTSFIVGMLCSIFGSFLCAKISRNKIVRDVAIACGISVLFGFASSIVVSHDIVKNVFLSALGIVAYAVGGMLGKRSLEAQMRKTA